MRRAWNVLALMVCAGALPAQNAPPSPRELNKEIPLALEALILALLEKDPGRRPGSASELAMLLDRVRPAL